MALRSNQTNFAAQTYPLPNYGSGGAGINNNSQGIIFRPGVASSKNAVATWAEVQTAIAAVNGALTVFIDDQYAACVVPTSSGTTNGLGAAILRPYDPMFKPSPTQLTVQDGAQLYMFAGIDGPLEVNCASITVPTFGFSYVASPQFFFCSFGASISLLSGAAVSPFTIPDGGSLAFIADIGITLNNSNAPTVAIVNLSGTSAGSQVVFLAFSDINWGGKPVTGTAQSTWTVQHDDTVATPPGVLGFPGTYTELRESDAANENYEPANPSDWGGQTALTVAAALDSLAADPAPEFFFSADASLTSATTQNISPGNGPTTTTAKTGIILSQTGTLQQVHVAFYGSALNNAGQTVTIQLQYNGAPLTGSAVTLAANSASLTTGSATFALSVTGSGGILNATLTPSAALSAPVTSVMVSAH